MTKISRYGLNYHVKLPKLIRYFALRNNINLVKGLTMLKISRNDFELM